MRAVILATALLALGASPGAAQRSLVAGERPQTAVGPVSKAKIALPDCGREHWPKCEFHKQYDCWNYFNVERSACRVRCKPAGRC